MPGRLSFFHMRDVTGVRCQSARGLAHSKTLRELRGRLERGASFWSAAVFCRFPFPRKKWKTGIETFAGMKRHCKSQRK
jgi:hypothetical protein